MGQGDSRQKLRAKVPASGIIQLWHPKRQQTAMTVLYLDGDQSGDQRQEHHFLSVPALLAIHFYFAFQFPPLPAILHENLGRRDKRHMIHRSSSRLNIEIGGQAKAAAASACFSTVFTPHLSVHPSKSPVSWYVEQMRRREQSSKGGELSVSEAGMWSASFSKGHRTVPFCSLLSQFLLKGTRAQAHGILSWLSYSPHTIPMCCKY